nr:hypothetical protein [bacterium]
MLFDVHIRYFVTRGGVETDNGR